ncbi:hypothetical protein VTJ49DRAFT_2671 [Mycothermus thermophilus]|uniref:Protein kinase domain-containing protein n=1 Tax=Humicola insolens TaxID=85995 RepID=A0ABR3V9A8_HUMIN
MSSSDEDDGPQLPLPPYVPGFSIYIKNHQAPEPFGPDYGWTPRPAVQIDRDRQWEMDREEFALNHPPIETKPPEGGSIGTSFTITDTKTLHRRGGPQVVVGYLGQDQTTKYILKIFDSVYYRLVEKGTEYDCTLWADKDYATEFWAYSAMMETEALRGMVPDFYGGFTTSLNTRFPGRQRSVRSILLEYIPGENMMTKISRSLDSNGVLQAKLLPPESQRLEVLRQIMTIRETLYFDGAISHRDIYPRNIVIQENNDGNVRVAFVDFNRALIYRPIESVWPFLPFGCSLAKPAGGGDIWGQ